MAKIDKLEAKRFEIVSELSSLAGYSARVPSVLLTIGLAILRLTYAVKEAHRQIGLEKAKRTSQWFLLGRKPH